MGLPNPSLVLYGHGETTEMREEKGATRFVRSETKQRAPDYAEPIIGVRAWRVDKNGVLRSLTRSGEQWQPREVKQASCERVESIARHAFAGRFDLPDPRRKVIRHEAPQSGCTCGLYAFYVRPSGKEQGAGFSVEEGHVTGVVSAWGERVILCEYGFKAQYMKLEALVLEQETIEVFGFPVPVRGAHEKLARRYGVPLLVPDQVEAFVRGRGAVFAGESPDEPVASLKKACAPTRKPSAFLKAIREWREESEDTCRGHRPGSQGGEGGAPTPPEAGGEDGPT